nr:PREDICTED: uncharacterized protein LOC108221448 [Daucus carota subsp. sativus]
MANSIRGVARRTLGVSSENVSDQKESWWWTDDVQEKAPGTKEGVIGILKLAKARNKRRQDICSVRYIKDEDDCVLLHDDDITARWGRYFSEIFNVARGREIVFDQEIVHVSDGDAGASHDITVAEVRAAFGMMGKGKTVGLDEIPIEVWQCLSEQGVRWLKALFNVIFRISRMPSEWLLSVVVPIYKNKGDAQSCSNCRGNIQSVVRKDLRKVFIDLEKAYDSVPWAVLWRCLAARGVPAVYIQTIQDMYSAAPIPWCMLFADDIVLIAESRNEVNVNLERWRASLEGYGLRLSLPTTEYLCANFSDEIHEEDVAVCIAEARVPQTNTFKYLGSIIQSNGDISADVTHRILSG